MQPPDAGKGAEMAELVCGGCRTSLTYIHGATRVQCPCCHTVNHALEVVEMKIDRISHLSDDIIDEILSRMSTKDVVRTSLLSRKWRHKWTTASSLAFGERFSHPQTIKSFKELVRIINHVLSHHVGPIHKFKLYYDFGLKERCDRCCLDTASNQKVDRWILHLSKGHIEELSLTFDNLIQRYMMPSCIFSCQNLTKLELCRCSLGSPGTFKGFGNLKVLRLINVILAQDLLEILLCCSPLLEWAYLWIADVVQDTKVDTPKYRFFEFIGRFTDCSALDILSTKADRLRTIGINGMPKFFCHLLHVRSLTLKGSFLEYLAVGGRPREFLLSDLQYLSMSINFSHQKEVSAALWLLRSAPNLQELNILEQEGSVDENVEPIFWEADHMNRLYTELRRVRMDYILGSEREIYIINYLLSTSPVLETMTINLIFPTSKSIVQQSLCFRNASEQVKIIFN